MRVPVFDDTADLRYRSLSLAGSALFVHLWRRHEWPASFVPVQEETESMSYSLGISRFGYTVLLVPYLESALWVKRHGISLSLSLSFLWMCFISLFSNLPLRFVGMMELRLYESGSLSSFNSDLAERFIRLSKVIGRSWDLYRFKDLVVRCMIYNVMCMTNGGHHNLFRR